MFASFNMLSNELTQDVPEAQMKVFNHAVVAARDRHIGVHHCFEFAAVVADESNGAYAVLVRPTNSFYDVLGVP